MDINECVSSPCQNNGSCVDLVGGYMCECAPGHEGDLCRENIDECTSQPCHNGATCEDGVNGYTCTCADGFTGMNFDILFFL